MRLLAILSVFLLTGMMNKPVSTLVLKNGKQLKIYNQPAIEKNMIAIRDKKGRKILISKTLIDWNATREDAPAIYQLAYPEKAKHWLANRKPDPELSRKPKKKIVITNDVLQSMEPSEGLASEWKAEQPNQGKTSASRMAKVSNRPVIETIKGARKLDLKQHMVSGKLVIFDFYADWCGPCRRLTPELERLVKNHPENLVLKKVDIQRWGTPVAQQFGIRSIPYVEVYDSRGRQKMKGNGFRVLRDLQKKANKGNW